MARQIATHEKFCDKRPKDGDAKATSKDNAKKSKATESVSMASVKKVLQEASKSPPKKRKGTDSTSSSPSSSSSSSDDEDIVETYKNIKAKAKAKILANSPKTCKIASSSGAAKSYKFKCKHCDNMVTEPHKCDWEPRKCRYCSMQIIARDIDKHESKCQKNTASAKKKKVEEKKPEASDPAPRSLGNAFSSKAKSMSTRRSFENVPPRSWSKYT